MTETRVFKQKTFIAAKETVDNTIDAVEQEEISKKRNKEDRHRLGQEVQEFYHEVISQPSQNINRVMTSSSSKRKYRDSTTDQQQQQQKQKIETYFCQLCKYHVPVSISWEDHLRSVPHLVSDDHKARKQYFIPESNRGYQLLKQMNWEEDQGLGRDNQGRLDPLKTQLKRDKRGLGKVVLPWKVTHFKSGEAPEEKTKKRKSEQEPSQNKSKAQRKEEERSRKNYEEAIRREIYSQEIVYPS